MKGFEENQKTDLFPDNVLETLEKGKGKLKIEVVPAHIGIESVEGIVESVERGEKKDFDWLNVRKADGKATLFCSGGVKELYVLGPQGERELLYNKYAKREL